MRMHPLRILSALMMVAASALPAAAQAWDAPTFFSPRPGEDIGVYGFKPKGVDWGIAGMWRQEGNLNLGVRVGVTSDDAVTVGSEFYKPLKLTGSPLLVAYMLGAGATFDGDFTSLRIPFGVSIGTELGKNGGMRLLPYVHPRVAFQYDVVDLGNGDELTESNFPFDVDIGADMPLGSQWVVHAGGTLTHGGSYGIGLAYRMSRHLIVR